MGIKDCVEGTARTAIVTGSDSGIGRATAVALARDGFDVGITWHSDEAGAEGTAGEVRQAGRRTVVRRLDATEPESGAAIVEEMVDELGRLDAFVNNAGTGHRTPFLELDLETWRRMLEVDLTAGFVLGQAAAKQMVAQGEGGRIVDVTSVHEHVPLRGNSAYCAAKAGLGLLTKAMALELAEHGITVNSIAPGEIATPMTENEDVDPHSLERPAIPLERPGDAREVAAAVAFLCSPQASYVTGISFVVDGGMLLMAAVANQEAS